MSKSQEEEQNDIRYCLVGGRYERGWLEGGYKRGREKEGDQIRKKNEIMHIH